MDTPPAQSLHNFIIRYVYLQHYIDLYTGSDHSFRLRNGPRKTVK